MSSRASGLSEPLVYRSGSLCVWWYLSMAGGMSDFSDISSSRIRSRSERGVDTDKAGGDFKVGEKCTGVTTSKSDSNSLSGLEFDLDAAASRDVIPPVSTSLTNLCPDLVRVSCLWTYSVKSASSFFVMILFNMMKNIPTMMQAMPDTSNSLNHL